MEGDGVGSTKELGWGALGVGVGCTKELGWGVLGRIGRRKWLVDVIEVHSRNV